MSTHLKRTLCAKAILSAAAGVAVAGVGASMARADVTGFGGSTNTGWQPNGNPAAVTALVPNVTGAGTIADVLQITSANNSEATSYWFTTAQDVTNFTANFTYNDVSGGGADGIGFVVQNQGTTALGAAGGAVGYGGITSSAALNLSVFGGSHFGLTGGGVANTNTGPTTSVNLSTANTPTNVTLSYVPVSNAGVITATFTQGANTFTKSTVVNIPALVGANTATVGFTGGTGGLNANQQISNFTYTAGTASLPTKYNVLQRGDSIVPLAATTAGNGNNIAVPVTDFPTGEAVPNVLDLNSGSKYLNFNNKGGNDGLAVTPGIGTTIVNGFQFVTANDSNNRDPMTITLEGSNDPSALASGNTNWTSLYSGDAGLSADPGRQNFGAEVDFSNGTPYLSYRLLVTTLRGGTTQNSLQFGDIELIGTAAPEPASLSLMGLGALGLLARRRRA